jgi:cytochrome b subunit of formate dehydrogenase
MRVRGFIGLLALFLVPLAFAAPDKGAAKDKDPNAKCADCHDQAGYKGSVHEMMGCTGCHAQHESYPHPANVPKPKCETCHADEVKTFSGSVHAERAKQGTADTPTCGNCHGNVHAVVASTDAMSPVSKKNLPGTCGNCHADPVFLSRHQIPFAHPVEAYRLSVHGRAIAGGNEKAAACSDCHSSHAIQPGSDPRSKVNRKNVPSTCGTCHAEIAKTYAASVHGRAVANGITGAPVCTDCHGEHQILAPQEPGSLVNPARVSTVTCGRCHGDERIAARFNLPIQNVTTYQDSYHGLASRGGSKTVANCASCHGIHNILPSADPSSTVNAKNLSKTCGACHPGAGEHFAIGTVHASLASRGEHPTVRWIRVAYAWIIPLTLGFMLLHNGLDFFSKLVRRSAAHHGQDHPRMNLNFRIAHWLVVLSFPTLAITGFALKFPESWWASMVPHRAGIHRVAAVLLCVSVLYHIVHLIVVKRDRVVLKRLLPTFQDVLDVIGIMRYNLGWQAERPVLRSFTYAEKMEYWAFMWGTIVMAGSGFLLWFNNLALRWFPKWATDAATALHFYEAILATGAILVWHFYMVVFDPEVYPMDRAWLTGNAPHARQKDDA